MKKRIISILLCLCFTMSLLPVQAMAATVTPAKPGGSGTADDPYQIGTAAQLYWFAGVVNGTLAGTAQNLSACAVLTANITVNATVLTESGALVSDTSKLIPWAPICGNTTSINGFTKYSGVFNGGNHTISGVYFNDSSKNYVGFCGASSSATIKDLKLTNSYINGSSNVGGICGYSNNSSTISNCTNGAVVSAYDYVGGICGRNMNSTIKKCGNTKAVNARQPSIESFCGGICGDNESGTISNCWNGGAVSAAYRGGGICGRNGDNASITNCYNYGAVSNNRECGTVVGANSTTGTTISNCYYDTNSSVSKGIGWDYSGSASVTGKTTAAFASGEVCYLLNKGTTDGTQVWYQNIDNNKTPDVYPQFNTGTVYKNSDGYSNVQPTIVFKDSYQPGKTYDGTALENPTENDVTIAGVSDSNVTFTWYKGSVSKENELTSPPCDVGSYVVKASIAATQTTAAAEATRRNITISTKSVNSPTLELSQTSFVGDNTEKKPYVTVKDGNTIIPEGEYTVEYSNNINPGTATITIKDKEGGNYTINASATFIITIDPSNIIVTAIAGGISKTYDGNAFELSTTKGTHFTWEGTGTARIAGYYMDSLGNTPTNINSNGAVTQGAAPVKAGSYYAKVFVTTEDNETSPSYYIPFTILNKDNIPFDGEGTQAEPYNINSALDLENLANLVKKGMDCSGKYFQLKSDINYSSLPVGCYDEVNNIKSPFRGNFNGGGHKVNLSMMNITTSMESALFGYLGKGSCVENIGTTGTITSLGKYSGGIVGLARDGDINISNCWSNVEMNYLNANREPECTYGGIVGIINNSANVTMTNCCFTGRIYTYGRSSLQGVGGLCGWNSATLTAVNCYVDARFGSDLSTTTGKYMARNGGSFTNCYYNTDKNLTEDNSTNITGTKVVTADFTSGKVVWLLQNGQSASSTLVWGQTLTGDTKNSDPVLLSDPAKAGYKVNRVTFEAGKGLESGLPKGASTDLYVNDSMTLPTLPLTQEEKTKGIQYSFQIKSGTATLDTAQNKLKDIANDVTITVTKDSPYTVITQSMDSTLGTVGGGGTYPVGTTAILKAVPRRGCKFVNWTSDAEGKAVLSTEKTLSITDNNTATYYAWFTKNSYMLTVVNSSGGTVTGLKNGGYSYNEEATLFAEANTDYTFDGWKNEYGVTVSSSPTVSIKVTGNMTITPVFTQIVKSVNYYTAAFYHQSGTLLKSESVAENGTITPPITPSKAGYNFVGWSLDGINPVALKDGSITITSNMSFKPLFQVKEDKYTLTVNGVVQGTYQPLSSVTAQVAQADIPDGKKFAYWADSTENAVSYSNPYIFSLTGNIALTAVYDNLVNEVIKKPTLTLSAATYESVSAGKHKMLWYAAMDLPEGYTLVESGILRVVSTTPQAKEQMEIDSEGIYRRIILVSASIPNQYYYSVTASVEKCVSIRAYIVVRDKDGNLETIYSDVQFGGIS